MTPAIIHIGWHPYDEETDDYTDEPKEVVGTVEFDLYDEVIMTAFDVVITDFEEKYGICVDSGGGGSDEEGYTFNFDLADYSEEDDEIPKRLLTALEATA